MSNYPLGAINDPRAPYNESLIEYKDFTVEVSVELGTMIKVISEVDENGYVDTEDFRNNVIKELKQKYNIDEKDTTLLDVHIWDWK